MKKFIYFFIPIFLAIWLITIVDCHFSGSEEDKDKLQALSKQFPMFTFKFDCDTYLRAQQKNDEPLPDDYIMHQIYISFFIDQSSDKNRDTSFIYLNVYNSKGEFQYQMYGGKWDFSKEYWREHY